MPTADLQFTEPLASRLLLGALADHEQRSLVLRLLRVDPEFRRQLAAVVPSFGRFDLDLAERYAVLLEDGEENGRAAVLQRAFDRAPDLDALMRAFTADVLGVLGETAGWIFSWTMAEFLLARVSEHEMSHYNKKTSLYLARLVVDVVEILGACGHAVYPESVLVDFRRRMDAADRGSQDRAVSPT